MESWTLALVLVIKATLAGAGHQFLVSAPQLPVLSRVGRDVILDCQLTPPQPVDKMELRWINVAQSYTSPVHVYKNGADDLTHQAAAYQYRTQLFPELIPQGNLSLRLKDVRPSDQGQYKCFVVSNLAQNEDKLTLIVAGIGEQPWMDVSANSGVGISVTCRSKGWFPRPIVQWTGGDGVNETGRATNTFHEDRQGLYQVQSTIVLPRSSGKAHSCLILNQELVESQHTRLEIADDLFPRTSGWLVAFWILVVLVLAAIGLALWFYRRNQQHIRALKKSAGALENDELRQRIDEQVKLAEREFEQHQVEKKRAMEARSDELQKLRQEFEEEKKAIRAEYELREAGFDKEKQLALKEYKKLEAEFEQWRPLVMKEWDRIRSHAVMVEPDPLTAGGCLELSPVQISARSGPPAVVPQAPERFDSVPYVLGKDGFTTGTHFWEVEVASKAYWDVGVASELVERKGMPTLTSDNGFWTLGRDGEPYAVSDKSRSAITVTKSPTKIGVFLDLGARKVDFYNSDTMFLLHTFNISGSGKIFPFFSPGWSDAPLTICPLKN